MQSNDCETFLSSSLSPIDEKAIQLSAKLRQVYNRDGRLTYGQFDFDDSSTFPQEYTEYLSASRSDSDFMSLSHIFVSTLAECMRLERMSKGGYVVCSEYTHDNTPDMAYFLVRDSDGVIFEQRNEGISLNEVRVINTAKLAMACRISEKAFASDRANNQYVSLTKGGKQDQISGYFYTAFGIKFGQTNTRSTKALYRIISTIEPPIDATTNEHITLETFRQKVHNYATSTVTGVISLKSMGVHFYNNENALIDFANANQILINNEFKPAPAALRKFLTAKVSADQINLSFPRGEYNKKIRLSSNLKNAVIIESPAFVTALQREIDDN